jgi:Spy/CpxP family protein refolding chaperone
VKSKMRFRMGALGALLCAVMVVPTLAQAKGEIKGQLKELKGQILKQMKLAPDQEKAFMAVDDKYAAERQKIIADLKQSRKDLRSAVAAAKPDETKVKDLVSALTAGQDKLFASFKSQRDEELALLSPVEQGKYLLALSQWRHEMMQKCMKEASEKKMKGKSGQKK